MQKTTSKKVAVKPVKAGTNKKNPQTKKATTAKRVRKPMTPEQRARKILKDRERRARIKAAKLAAQKNAAKKPVVVKPVKAAKPAKTVKKTVKPAKKIAKTPVKSVSKKPAKKAVAKVSCCAAKKGCGGCKHAPSCHAGKRPANVPPFASPEKLFAGLANWIVNNVMQRAVVGVPVVAKDTIAIPGGEIHIVVTKSQGVRTAREALTQNVAREISAIVDARYGNGK